MASQIEVPMVYVPIESVMSMFYGQSTKILAEIFDAVESMGSGAIMFIGLYSFFS